MDNNESDLGLGISSVSPGPVDAIQELESEETDDESDTI